MTMNVIAGALFMLSGCIQAVIAAHRSKPLAACAALLFFVAGCLQFVVARRRYVERSR